MFEGFFRKNLSLKILSLVLALCLWFVVHLTQHVDVGNRPEVNLELPLKVENLSADLMVLEAPTEVFVSITGSRKDLEEVKASDFKAYVNLQGKVGGAYSDIPVRVNAPAGLKAVSVSPAAVNVVLDLASRKTVPVTWEMERMKTPPTVRINPKEVTVSGSKIRVDRVVAARVDILPPAASSDLLQELSPLPVDALGRPVPALHVKPGNVRVKILTSPLPRPVAVRPDITGTGSLESIVVSPPALLAEIPRGQSPPSYFSTTPIDITGKHGKIVEKVKAIVPAGIKLQDSGQVTVTLMLGNTHP